MLSDVGGLAGALAAAIPASLILLNHNYLETYIAAQLYKIAPGKHDPKDYDKERFTPKEQYSLADFWFEKIPSKLHCTCKCCKCCRRGRRSRELYKARQSYIKEIDIVEVVREQRFFRAAVEKLFDKKQVKELEDSIELFTISASEDEIENGSVIEVLPMSSKRTTLGEKTP